MSDDEGWVTGDALFVLRQMAKASATDDAPSVASGIFMVGDEVLLKEVAGRVGRPEEIGVLIESPLVHGSCLRIKAKADGLEQWWYWSRVIGWRRP